MAITPNGSRLSFGVTAETRELACNAFDEALKGWLAALSNKKPGHLNI